MTTTLGSRVTHDPPRNFLEATMKLKTVEKLKKAQIMCGQDTRWVQCLCTGRSMPLSGFMDFSPTARLHEAVPSGPLKTPIKTEAFKQLRGANKYLFSFQIHRAGVLLKLESCDIRDWWKWRLIQFRELDNSMNGHYWCDHAWTVKTGSLVLLLLILRLFMEI